MVFEGVVGVLTTVEQPAELDRLIGLVVVHRPLVEVDQPQRQARRQREGHDDRRACRAVARQGGGGREHHFAEP